MTVGEELEYNLETQEKLTRGAMRPVFSVSLVNNSLHYASSSKSLFLVLKSRWQRARGEKGKSG